MTTVNIDRDEVLRYLGHRGQTVDERLAGTIDRAIEECRTLCRPKYTYRMFDIIRKDDGISLPEAGLALTGDAIAAHLKGADRCALLAATLGVEVESRIRMLEHSDLTASLAMDAAATAAIEDVCDQAGAKMEIEARGLARYTGSRFSPGYGDLPLDLQPALLQALDTSRRIGLTCTGSLILLPRKSVTAVVGLYEKPVGQRRPGCETCPQRDTCDFRRCAQRGDSGKMEE